MKQYKINRYKAEAPIMATFFVMALFISLYFFPNFRWMAFLGFPLFFVFYVILRKLKLAFFKRNTFLTTDAEGIRYCFHLYQQPRFLRWDQVDKVNYQLYEINFRLKITGEIISFQKGYFANTEEMDAFCEDIKLHCETM